MTASHERPPCECSCSEAIAALTARLDALESERSAYFLDDREVPLPIEPLYPIEAVAAMIPCSKFAVWNLMKRYPEMFGEPLYRASSTGRRYRMLRASEVRAIRARMIRKRRPKRGDALASIKHESSL